MHGDTSTRTRPTMSRWWHGAVAAVIVASLLLQLGLLLAGGADANSGQSGDAVPLGVRLWRFFSYFTIQSNVIVLAACLTLTRRPDRDGSWWRVVRLDALLGIVVTGLVYAVVLAPQIQLTGAALVATIGLHYVAPWATLAGWLLFGPRPRMTWSTVAAAFAWPLLWLASTFGRGAATDWYPYPFLDVTTLGAAVAIRNAGLVLVIGALLAVILKVVDARLPVPRDR